MIMTTKSRNERNKQNTAVTPKGFIMGSELTTDDTKLMKCKGYPKLGDL